MPCHLTGMAWLNTAIDTASIESQPWLEHRVAGVEPEQHPARRSIHLGMHDPVLTRGEDISHNSIDWVAAVDCAGGSQIVHRRDHFLCDAMNVHDHDSIERTLAGSKFFL